MGRETKKGGKALIVQGPNWAFRFSGDPPPPPQKKKNKRLRVSSWCLFQTTKRGTLNIDFPFKFMDIWAGPISVTPRDVSNSLATDSGRFHVTWWKGPFLTCCTCCLHDPLGSTLGPILLEMVTAFAAIRGLGGIHQNASRPFSTSSDLQGHAAWVCVKMFLQFTGERAPLKTDT